MEASVYYSNFVSLRVISEFDPENLPVGMRLSPGTYSLMCWLALLNAPARGFLSLLLGNSTQIGMSHFQDMSGH